MVEQKFEGIEFAPMKIISYGLREEEMLKVLAMDGSVYFNKPKC